MTPFKDGDPLVTALIQEVDRAVKQAMRGGGKYDTVIRHILNEHLCKSDNKQMVVEHQDGTVSLIADVNYVDGTVRAKKPDDKVRNRSAENLDASGSYSSWRNGAYKD